MPQAPFKYLTEIFKDTAFRASQYKMLHKLIYTKKLLHIGMWKLCNRKKY